MTNLFFRMTLSVLLTLGVSANAQEPTRAEPAGGAHEGIKVHGHWTIEVRNPDGKLVTHREFENALNTPGYPLAAILGRTATVGAWSVTVDTCCGNPSPCLFADNITSAPCVIAESTNSQSSAPNFFKNLTISAPALQKPGWGTLTLQGTFTVQRSGTSLSLVNTNVLGCDPTVAPASCPPVSSANAGGGIGNVWLTNATIAPIAVTIGQLVQVTVVLSFS